MMTLKNLLTLLLIWMTMLWWLIMVLVAFWSLKPRANYYEILDQEAKAEVSFFSNFNFSSMISFQLA